MKITKHKSKYGDAFTLIEVLIVLVISSLLIIAAVTIHGQVKVSAAKINSHLDENTLPQEILQRIAEDLDRLAAPGFDTTVTIKSRFTSNYVLSQLIIENKYYDNSPTPKPHTFEKVIWQTNYDPVEDSLILYRAHAGLTLEDAVIDAGGGDNIDTFSQAAYQEKGIDLFVPLASGITWFKFEAMENDRLYSAWAKTELPKAVVASISFTPPQDTFEGTVEVLPEDIFTRTVAIDRTRKIAYKLTLQEYDMEIPDDQDPNTLDTETDSADTTTDTERTETDQTEPEPEDV